MVVLLRLDVNVVMFLPRRDLGSTNIDVSRGSSELLQVWFQQAKDAVSGSLLLLPVLGAGVAARAGFAPVRFGVPVRTGVASKRTPYLSK